MAKTYHTKKRMIELHLIEHGSITSWEAIQLFAATRLSAVIHALKESEGWVFSLADEKQPGGSTYRRYTYVSHPKP